MIAKNNPFNIRYSKKNNWVGQIGRRRGFVVFDTIDNGIRAGLKLLFSYALRGFNNIDDIIYRYAPPTENETVKYVQFVKDSPLINQLKYPPHITTFNDICIIAQRILLYENNYYLKIDDLRDYMERLVLPLDCGIYSSVYS